MILCLTLKCSLPYSTLYNSGMKSYPIENALVSARGKDERFTVFSVREKKQTVDLKSVPTPGNPSHLVQDVPWTEISYLSDDPHGSGHKSK
jgi:hypothetical protein